jgi:hypothetical protein
MNNPQAFPRPVSEFERYGEGYFPQYGMTLLDYYAGIALSNSVKFQHSPEFAAKNAFDYAEAMLKERENRGVV